MAFETLGVDPESLSGYGNEMLSAASQIPMAPPPLVLAGADPITLKIMGSVPAIEAPIQTGLPEVKAEAGKTAADIVAAAAKYLQTDEQLAKAYEGQFEGQAGSPGNSGAGAGAAGGAGAGAASSCAPPAGGGTGGMDQMGQLMSMPMQMAGQAVQLPMQAMGALGSIAQGIMQGVQQVGQMAGGMGGGDDASLGELEKVGEHDTDESRTEKDEAPTSGEGKRDGAASGRPDEERAPVEPARPQTSPRTEVPAPPVEEKQPAQTRPAEVAQRMNL
jgi:hypothetical protein